MLNNGQERVFSTREYGIIFLIADNKIKYKCKYDNMYIITI